jgi:hypothetical protein
MVEGVNEAHRPQWISFSHLPVQHFSTDATIKRSFRSGEFIARLTVCLRMQTYTTASFANQLPPQYTQADEGNSSWVRGRGGVHYENITQTNSQ